MDKCPKCGGKLKKVGYGKYKCQWCGAGIGVGGASPPTAAFMGNNQMDFITGAFIFLPLLIITLIYAVASYLLGWFNLIIFAVLAVLTAAVFLWMYSKAR